MTAPIAALAPTVQEAPIRYRERLIDVARQIISETGNFDFSMREFATRARVSMTTPYRLFGSKGGIILAVLRSDQTEYRATAAKATDEQIPTSIFVEFARGMTFFSQRQSFYRSLFRAAFSISGDVSEDPAREVLPGMIKWSRRAQRLGLLRSDVDPSAAGDALTSVYSAEMRLWANSEYDLDLALARCSFATASLLAGLGADPYAAQMRERAIAAQTAIAQLRSHAVPEGSPTY